MRFANPAAIDVFDDVIRDLPDPADAFAVCLARPSLATDMFAKCIDDGAVSGEFEVRTVGGTRWHRIELRHVIDPEMGDRCILAVEEDVTSIKHAETAAAMSERMLYDAIESLSVGFIMLDSDQRVVLVNNKYRELHRNIGGEVTLGMPFEELLSISTHSKFVLGQDGGERLTSVGFIGFIIVMSFVDIQFHGLEPESIGAMFDRIHNSIIFDQRLLWVFPLIYLAIKGGGPISVDALILRRFSGQAR